MINFLRAVERFREQDGRASNLQDQLHTEVLAKAALSEALSRADSIDQYLANGPRGTIGTTRDPEWAKKLPTDQEQLA